MLYGILVLVFASFTCKVNFVSAGLVLVPTFKSVVALLAASIICQLLPDFSIPYSTPATLI